MKKFLLVLVLAAACGGDSGGPLDPGAGGPNGGNGGNTGGTSPRVVAWPASLTMNANQTFALDAAVENVSASQTGAVTCISSAPTVVSVDNCLVRAHTNGSATITVTSSAAPNAPASVPVTVTTQVPQCSLLSGSHFFRVTVASDPSARASAIGMHQAMELTITRNPDNSITIFAASPFIGVSGVLNSNCEFVATGKGTTGGVPNVSARLSGSLAAVGTPSVSYTVNTNGALGGQAVVYTFTKM